MRLRASTVLNDIKLVPEKLHMRTLPLRTRGVPIILFSNLGGKRREEWRVLLILAVVVDGPEARREDTARDDSLSVTVMAHASGRCLDLLHNAFATPRITPRPQCMPQDEKRMIFLMTRWDGGGVAQGA